MCVFRTMPFIVKLNHWSNRFFMNVTGSIISARMATEMLSNKTSSYVDKIGTAASGFLFLQHLLESESITLSWRNGG